MCGGSNCPPVNAVGLRWFIVDSVWTVPKCQDLKAAIITTREKLTNDSTRIPLLDTLGRCAAVAFALCKEKDPSVRGRALRYRET